MAIDIHDQHVGNAVAVEIAQVNAPGDGNPFLGGLPIIMKQGRVDVAFPGHVAKQKARRFGGLDLGDFHGLQPVMAMVFFRAWQSEIKMKDDFAWLPGAHLPPHAQHTRSLPGTIQVLTVCGAHGFGI